MTAVVMATSEAARDPETGSRVWCDVLGPADREPGVPAWQWGVGEHRTACGRSVTWGQVVDVPRPGDPLVRAHCQDCRGSLIEANSRKSTTRRSTR